MILARVRVEFIKPLPPEIRVDLSPGEQVIGMEPTGGGLNVYIAEHIDWESNAATNLRGATMTQEGGAMDRIPETGKCILCGAPFGHYGNNPEPVKRFDEGRCCDDCNSTRVIPARLDRLGLRPRA